MIALSAHTATAVRRLVDEVQDLEASPRTVLRLLPYALPDEFAVLGDALAGLGRLEDASAHDGPEVTDLVAILRAGPPLLRLSCVGMTLNGDELSGLPALGAVFSRFAELAAAVEADRTGWPPAVVIAAAAVLGATQDMLPAARRAIARTRVHLTQPEPLRPLWAAIEDAAGASTDARLTLALEVLVLAARDMAPEFRRGWVRTVRAGQLKFPQARAFYAAVADLLEAVSAEARQ